MRWGIDGKWGIEALWGIDRGLCVLVNDRVLVQMDDAPANRFFRDFLCVLSEGFDEFIDVSNEVKVAFDLNTAVGVQLDAIGSVVGLPRQGYPDARYRTFLKIQIELLLSAVRDEAEWTGTHENILTICRTFLGPAAPTITLNTSGPYNFELSIPGITLSELNILVGFICKAIYAGVLGTVNFVIANDSLWDSDSVGPIPNGGIWCSDSVAVVPCATWNFSIPIGSSPCG